MTRYQIVYNKSGYPLTTWSNNPDQAHELAEKFRKVGYSVDVWEHTDKGAHKTSLYPRPIFPTFTPGTSRNRKEVFSWFDVGYTPLGRINANATTWMTKTWPIWQHRRNS